MRINLSIQNKSEEDSKREVRARYLITYGKKDILESRIENEVPEFLMQGLLITNIQEAVGGTLS